MSSSDESLREQYAARFQDPSVVARYHLRPAYPPEVFAILRELLVDEPRAILDVGCGPGMITRGLLAGAERIDAVDLSPQMLEQARTLPGGNSPKIRWLLGRAEDVALEPPYALITAGRSLHWLDWDVALPRFAQLLTARGVLAIVQTREQNAPWHQRWREILSHYRTNYHSRHIEMMLCLDTPFRDARNHLQTRSPLR